MNDDQLPSGAVVMAGQKTTRRQKDISRLLREKKYQPRKKLPKGHPAPVPKHSK